MTYFSTHSVIISMSWQLHSLNSMIAAIVWKKIDKRVSVSTNGHVRGRHLEGIGLNWVVFNLFYLWKLSPLFSQMVTQSPISYITNKIELVLMKA